MRLAIAEAAQSAMHGEVPVGAVVVVGQDLVGAAGNLRESQVDPTAHAEILAIRQAARLLGSWRLSSASLYVTQEPCPMCAGAIVNARVSRLVFGCANPKAGAVQTLYTLLSDPRLNHQVQTLGGVLAGPCAELLRGFFENMRADAQRGLATATERHARYRKH
jgi:tRNA(adenine34) deaminase